MPILRRVRRRRRLRRLAVLGGVAAAVAAVRNRQFAQNERRYGPPDPAISQRE